MNRFISLSLCLCLILCSCGSAPAESSLVNTTASTQPVGIAETAPPATASMAEEVVDGTATISETVVLDNGDFKLTAKEIDFTDDYDIRVKFLAENNSGKNVSILGNYFSINGITMYCSFYIEVAAGKKANDYLEIDRDDLVYVGIQDIATIQAHDCYIYDQDISKKITDFTFELSTSISDGYQQEIDRSGQTVYNQNGVVVKYRGIVPGTFSGEELEFYVENNTDTNLGIYVDNVSVNGFMVYGSMVAYAYPNCVTYERLDFSSSDLEDNDIESIEEVSLNLYGYDQDANKKVWTSDEFTVGRDADLQTFAEPENTPPASEEAASSEYTSDTAVALAAKVIEETLSEDYDDVSVSYEANSIVIDLTFPNLASSIQTIIASNDPAKLQIWDSVVSSQRELCINARDLAISYGVSDASVLFNLNNDVNPENALLIILNGNVIYDVVNSK